MANYISAVGNLSGLQLISTTTALPPLSVSNSNLVSNLNVQYFNSQLSSYYTNATNISSGILNPSFGGTGITSMSNGFLHFGSNGVLGQSSNLFWNSTSNFLGINNSNPSFALDVTGNLKVSSNIISTLPVGTAPFSIASTTLVTNLNTQYLNNNPSSYYTNATNISSGLLAVGFGGTGITSMSTGFLHFGSNGILGQSSNLFWNNQNGFLGLNNPNPACMLDITGYQNSTSNIYPITARGGPFRQVRIVPQNTNGAVEILFQQSTIFDDMTNSFWTGIYNGGARYSINQVNLSSSIASFYSNGSVALGVNNPVNITSNGYLGIGTSSPIAPLHISASISYTATYAWFNADGNKYNYGYATNNPGSVSLIASNKIVASEMNATSDFRKKHRFQNLDLQHEIDFILKLQPKLFQWKNQPQDSYFNYGFIAQDIAKLNHPELIGFQPDDSIQEEPDYDNFISPKKMTMTLDYDKFIPIHTAVIQHLFSRVDQLQNLVSSLSNELSLLKNKLNL